MHKIIITTFTQNTTGTPTSVSVVVLEYPLEAGELAKSVYESLSKTKEFPISRAIEYYEAV